MVRLARTIRPLAKLEAIFSGLTTLRKPRIGDAREQLRARFPKDEFGERRWL